MCNILLAPYSPSFFISIFPFNVKYVTYGRSVTKSKIAMVGGRSGLAEGAVGDEKEKKGGDTHRRYHIGQVGISEPPYASSWCLPSWIWNESNGFDALRDHE